MCWVLRIFSAQFIISPSFNILRDTPNVKDSTCSWIYSRKASLDQRPTIIMMMTDVPERKIVISPPDWIEYNLISSFLKPKHLLQSKLLLLVFLIEHDRLSVVMSSFFHYKINKLLTHLMIHVSYIIFGLLLPMKSLEKELYQLT